jgi:hypothetical protein
LLVSQPPLRMFMLRARVRTNDSFGAVADNRGVDVRFRFIRRVG